MKVVSTVFGEIEKPTLEQVAWVFEMISHPPTGSFRYLIYDKLGFGFEAYVPLYESGGMDITNAIFEVDNKEAADEV